MREKKNIEEKKKIVKERHGKIARTPDRKYSSPTKALLGSIVVPAPLMIPSRWLGLTRRRKFKACALF